MQFCYFLLVVIFPFSSFLLVDKKMLDVQAVILYPLTVSSLQKKVRSIQKLKNMTTDMATWQQIT
ncbi:MAG: hypothetical protein D3915_01785 [Candidatus Electrothrix sp. AU1_5]|nr:hypothetical protein [Candidatus Electrothrix gigas]MCI5226616.1 hypothetical protein [Candidatus Electrothrix gigas]